MIFLHPEFFLWMLPLILVLFYFWQTQKSAEYPLFREAILQRLRAPEVTMGLKGRNTLFLIAAVLIISAMAQPVILQKEVAREVRVDIHIALNLSKKSIHAFEREKIAAMDMIHFLRGENIALIGYDEQLYRISPLTSDTAMLVMLVQGLDADVMHTRLSDIKKIDALRKGNALQVIIGDPIEEHNTDLSTLAAKIDKIKFSQAVYAHIPLFYYPLGLAMVLIWIALSSMSKRQNVSLTVLLALLSFATVPTDAGILDFQKLRAGYESYEKGDYAQSAMFFEAYRQEHDSPEIRYNLANAYYKANEYEKARYWYEHIYTNDPALVQKAAYNLAHADKKIKKNRRKIGEDKGTVAKKQISPLKKKQKTRLYPM